MSPLPVPPHNPNIPVRRHLLSAENRRTGGGPSGPHGGSDFRRMGSRVFVTVNYRGRRIRTSFGGSAQSYSRASRWYTYFKNLKAREGQFWFYAPHIHYFQDRCIVYGYRCKSGRTRRVISLNGVDRDERWQEACSLFYEFSIYNPVRDKQDAIIRDFNGWKPPEFPDIEEVKEVATASLGPG